MYIYINLYIKKPTQYVLYNIYKNFPCFICFFHQNANAIGVFFDGYTRTLYIHSLQ